MVWIGDKYSPRSKTTNPFSDGFLVDLALKIALRMPRSTGVQNSSKFSGLNSARTLVVNALGNHNTPSFFKLTNQFRTGTEANVLSFDSSSSLQEHPLDSKYSKGGENQMVPFIGCDF